MRKKKIIILNNFSEQNENIDEDYTLSGLNKELNSDIYFKYKNNKVVIVKEGSDSSKTDSTDIPNTDILSSESINNCFETVNKNEVLDTDIIDIKSLYGKEIYYYNMLEKFFQNQPDKEIKSSRKKWISPYNLWLNHFRSIMKKFTNKGAEMLSKEIDFFFELYIL